MMSLLLLGTQVYTTRDSGEKSRHRGGDRVSLETTRSPEPGEGGRTGTCPPGQAPGVEAGQLPQGPRAQER